MHDRADSLESSLVPGRNFPRGRQIELLGAPGVGKTLFSKLLARTSHADLRLVPYKQRVGEVKLRRRLSRSRAGFAARWIPSQLKRGWARSSYHIHMRDVDTLAVCDFSASRPDLLGHLLLKLAQGSAPAYDKALVLHWFDRLFADYHVACSNLDADEVLVLDESFAQKAVSLALHLGFHADDIDRYIGHVPLPDLLVVLEAEPGTIYERNETRGWPGWLKADGPEGKRRALELCLASVRAATDAYADRGARVLRIVNDKPGRKRLAREVASIARALTGGA